MAEPAKIRVQEVTSSTEGTFYVPVDLSTTYETRHSPTPAELAGRTQTLPSGYTWRIVEPTTGSGFDYSYLFNRTGTDFTGRSFVSTPAPAVSNPPKSVPRLKGNDYAYVRQVALNTILALRFPAFSLHPSWKATWAGPTFEDPTDRNALLTRGFNTLAESSYPKQFARGKINLLVPGGYEFCSIVANRLPDSDPRKAWLREWVNERKLIDNQPAAYAMGYEAYEQYQQDGWAGGQALMGITPNFEVNQASPRSNNELGTQWRNMDAYFMDGFRAAALAKGQTPAALVMYDWSGLAQINLRVYSRDQASSGVYNDLDPAINYDPEPGIPFYFSYAAMGFTFRGGTKSAPVAATIAYSQHIKQFGGYAGSSEYMRNTWGETESFWQKNTDGSFKTRQVNGVTLLVPRTDAYRTVINGETTDILGAGSYSIGEGDNFLYLTYERIQIAIVELVLRAGGKHLPKSTDRQAGWENLKLVQWQRHDAEFKQENEITKPDGSGPAINPATGAPYDPTPLNNRPQNPDFLEGDVIAHPLLGRDMYRFWMQGQPTLTGQGVSNTGNNNARASYEMAMKGLQRVSTLNWIRDNVFQYLICNYPIRNIDRYRGWYDPREEWEKKPILFGGLCPGRTDRSGKPYVWFFGRFPGQDIDRQTEVKYWWVDASGNAVTGAYRFVIDGRKTYLDEHEVPAAVGSLPPSRFRIQCKDLTGETYTATGDYRDARITTHPTPPTVAV